VEASLDISVCHAGEPRLQSNSNDYSKVAATVIVIDQEVYHPNHKCNVGGTTGRTLRLLVTIAYLLYVQSLIRKCHEVKIY